MDRHELLLFLHILGAFLIVAGAGVGSAAGIAAARSTSARTIALLATMAHRSELFAVVPGGLLTFIFGTWLVSEEAGFAFGDAWVTASYVLWAIAMGLGTGVMGRYTRRLQAAAEEVAARGTEATEELRAFTRAPYAMITGNALHVITLLLLYLMVAKPGA